MPHALQNYWTDPYFCVEQAFDRSLEAIERVLRQSISKDTLERINRRVGEQAEAYLDELAAPPAEHEGELLVITGDGKGVPLVKPELASVPIFDPEEHRGNRRMATLASVYSVDRFARRPEDIVAALFRDADERPERMPRPKPVGKQLTARFARERDLGNGPEYVSGPIEAFRWASRRVADRLQPCSYPHLFKPLCHKDLQHLCSAYPCPGKPLRRKDLRTHLQRCG